MKSLARILVALLLFVGASTLTSCYDDHAPPTYEVVDAKQSLQPDATSIAAIPVIQSQSDVTVKTIDVQMMSYSADATPVAQFAVDERICRQDNGNLNLQATSAIQEINTNRQKGKEVVSDRSGALFKQIPIRHM